MCPLFRLPGVSLDTWAIDVMHTWHLGPIQQLVSLSLHFCLESGLWAPMSSGIDAADKKEISLMGIKTELFAFYKELREGDSEWRRKGTEVSWLTSELFSV